MEIIASNLQLHGVSRILANTGLHRVFLISLGISRIEYLQKGLIIMIYHPAPGTCSAQTKMDLLLTVVHIVS